MQLLDRNQQKAVMELLSIADGDIALVEQALSECRSAGKGDYFVFTFDDVKKKISDLQRIQNAEKQPA
jgi:hypothetical protein